MQDRPLTLTHFFDRAERLFPEKEIVTNTADGLERTNYGEWAERTRRLGGVLDDLGISRRRPGGHVRVEHRPPPRAVLRRAVHGPGAAHAQHPAVPRAAHLHRRTTPRTRSIFVDRSLAGAAVAAARRRSRPSATSWSWTTARARCRPTPDGIELHDYEDAAGRAPTRSSSTSRTRTRPRRCATRAAPRATRRASSTRTARRGCTRWACSPPTRSARTSATRSCRSCRCSTPTPGAWPTPRWPCGATLVMPGPDLSAPALADAHRARAGHRRGGRAHHLDGRAARAEGPRHLATCGPSRAAARRCPRRCRRATGRRPACRSSRPGA